MPSDPDATLSNFAEVFFQNGAVFNNNGIFLAQTSNGFSDGFFDNGGGGTFNNTGTFTRNTAGTVFTIGPDIVFNNSGTVNVQSGTLSLQGGDGGNTTGISPFPLVRSCNLRATSISRPAPRSAAPARPSLTLARSTS